MADKRKSDWLKIEKDKNPSGKQCKACKGTGSTGAKDSKGQTIACPSCNGWGY